MENDFRKIRKVAVEHFYDKDTDEGVEDNYSLNRDLNYHLLLFCDRLEETFGEITKRDIVLFSETWKLINKKNPIVFEL